MQFAVVTLLAVCVAQVWAFTRFVGIQDVFIPSDRLERTCERQDLLPSKVNSKDLNKIAKLMYEKDESSMWIYSYDSKRYQQKALAITLMNEEDAEDFYADYADDQLGADFNEDACFKGYCAVVHSVDPRALRANGGRAAKRTALCMEHHKDQRIDRLQRSEGVGRRPQRRQIHRRPVSTARVIARRTVVQPRLIKVRTPGGRIRYVREVRAC
jgi:hypothetical protein